MCSLFDSLFFLCCTQHCTHFSLQLFASSSFHVTLTLRWQLLRDVPLLQNRSFTGREPSEVFSLQRQATVPLEVLSLWHGGPLSKSVSLTVPPAASPAAHPQKHLWPKAVITFSSTLRTGTPCSSDWWKFWHVRGCPCQLQRKLFVSGTWQLMTSSHTSHHYSSLLVKLLALHVSKPYLSF